MAEIKKTSKGIFYLVDLEDKPMYNEIYFDIQQALANQAIINSYVFQGISKIL